MTAQPYFPPTQTDCVIDLSHAQTIAAPGAAFATAKASGVEMVICKATQGTSFTDPTFAARRQAAQAAGLLFGAYHFCDGSDPVAQMRHFLSIVGDRAGIVLALDAEKNPASQVTQAQLAQMVTYLVRQTDRYPLLYMGASGPAGTGYTFDTILSGCELWLPEYGSRPICPAGFPEWIMHQYTGDGINGSGYVAGIGSKLDRSYFAGTVAELHAWHATASGSAQDASKPVAITTLPATPAPPLQGASDVSNGALPPLRKLQADLGVSVDGVYGPETADAIERYYETHS